MTDHFDKALEALCSGKDLPGKDGVLTPLIKQLTEAALNAKLDQHLTHDTQPNRRNSHSHKIVKAATGSFELETPRDHAGTFEPGCYTELFTPSSYRDIQYDRGLSGAASQPLS